MKYREERDSCGTLNVEENAYYGIQSLRAKENFKITGNMMSKQFIDSIVLIKKAAAIVNSKYGILDVNKANAIIYACDKILTGEYNNEFIVDIIQGSAGTSFNMNVNEVIANIAIEKLSGKKGDYSLISPNDHVNMEQSTNDVIPSAGKITVLKLTKGLIQELKNLVSALHEKEREYDSTLKMGRTQLQDAVPMRYGQAFSAYCSMLERDIGRIENRLDEMRYINMGGTAIGSAINVKKDYYLHIVEEISKQSNEKLERSHNLFDGTQNVDCFAAFSGVLKTCALNLSKMSNDLRLLSSGPKTGIAEITLPAKQNGSSIMPAKINPVIPEVMNQVAFLVIGHDVTITMACEGGQLELNAFEPVIFYQLFESITAMTGAINTLTENCIRGLIVNKDRCKDLVDNSIGIITALNPYIGYQKSAEIAKISLKTGVPIKKIIIDMGLFDEETITKILDPYAVTDPHF